ncbi:hypothetical protein AB2I44_00120 [Escherichia coli]|uniref:hypothetical protein n=1 Tax=Escherichia coli TaxID=562 RepID=UPI00158257BB|nr:hypothetical protein [Escherichia coli]MEC9834694.1 hypothetical protein [Escherichia marmotae]EFM0603128.1 hypothetical protein [Escherichia coli]MBW1115112.1 hypothetical protein [Escherichia coli]MED8862664.1 hypothetical protein [Escherichia marmotae]HAI5249715.1 hypothetical protein [Escherichia coli]
MDWKDLASTAVYTGMTDENENIWERVDGVDVAFIGAFLTAHLSLEKYITDYLGLRYPSLAWGDAKLTFSQKIALIQHEPAKPPYDEIYLRIKDFNSIRNKISHQLNYQITDKEKSKFVDFYMKITKASKTKPNIDIDNMADLLDFFVSMTKSYFASAISYYHYNKKVAGKSNKID